jgi:hypothetical protein
MPGRCSAAGRYLLAQQAGLLDHAGRGGVAARRRLTAVLAQVHKAVAAVAEDDDLDPGPALAECVQLGLSGPHLVPPQEPAARPPLTVTAFEMHLHAATTVDGRDRWTVREGRAQRRRGGSCPTMTCSCGNRS